MVGGQVVALVAIAVASVLRWAVTPLLGPDASFIIALPAVLIAALVGGPAGGATALVVGSVLDLVFSAGVTGGFFAHATLRFVVWLASASFIMMIALELRVTLFALGSREHDLVTAADRLRLVVREMEHRGRNALAIVQAVSNETARSAASVKDYQHQLGGKLAALASSYSTLTKVSVGLVDLATLVDTVLAPFRGRLTIQDGPACSVRPEASVPLALTLHELATNAYKYGALSVASGEVFVSWTIDQDGLVGLRWIERGSPPPKDGGAEGFGSELLRRAFKGVPGGAFRAERRPEGMSFEICLESASEAAEPRSHVRAHP